MYFINILSVNGDCYSWLWFLECVNSLPFVTIKKIAKLYSNQSKSVFGNFLAPIAFCILRCTLKKKVTKLHLFLYICIYIYWHLTSKKEN